MGKHGLITRRALLGGIGAAIPATAWSAVVTPEEGRANVNFFTGPYVSVPAVKALRGAFASIEQAWSTYSRQRWANEGAFWEHANYYDRGKIWYSYWARTGEQQYLDRGHATIVNYRTHYVESSQYGATPEWTFVQGLGLHYMLTGDLMSKRAVERMLDFGFAPYYSVDWAGSNNDIRIQGRALETVLWGLIVRGYANESGVTPAWSRTNGDRFGNRDLVARLPALLTAILDTQLASGEWWTSFRHRVPFMMGILNSVLIDIYRLAPWLNSKFPALNATPDARIPVAIRKNLDFLKQYFGPDPLIGPYNFLPYDLDSPKGWAGDLNMLEIDAWGFVADVYNDISYLAWGDALLAGRMSKDAYEGTTSFQGSKQFNQTYSTGPRYFYWREQALGGGRTPPSPQPR